MIRKIIPWILVILWTALIFYLSHQPANRSNGLSKGATEIIVEIVEKVAPKVDINKRSFNHIIRKNAHFFAYLVLGTLVANGLRSSWIKKVPFSDKCYIDLGQVKKKKKNIIKPI